MATVRALALAALFFSFVAACDGELLFSKLPRTLDNYNFSIRKSGSYSWGEPTNCDLGAQPELGKHRDFKLQDSESQALLSPRKPKGQAMEETDDHLNKDKTCQHAITSNLYSSSNVSVTYTVLRDVPTADYFIRAYVYDALLRQQLPTDRLSVTI